MSSLDDTSLTDVSRLDCIQAVGYHSSYSLKPGFSRVPSGLPGENPSFAYLTWHMDRIKYTASGVYSLDLTLFQHYVRPPPPRKGWNIRGHIVQRMHRPRDTTSKKFRSGTLRSWTNWQKTFIIYLGLKLSMVPGSKFMVVQYNKKIHILLEVYTPPSPLLADISKASVCRT
jgi:hypothetical protein